MSWKNSPTLLILCRMLKDINISSFTYLFSDYFGKFKSFFYPCDVTALCPGLKTPQKDLFEVSQKIMVKQNLSPANEPWNGTYPYQLPMNHHPWPLHINISSLLPFRQGFWRPGRQWKDIVFWGSLDISTGLAFTESTAIRPINPLQT